MATFIIKSRSISLTPVAVSAGFVRPAVSTVCPILSTTLVESSVLFVSELLLQAQKNPNAMNGTISFFIRNYNLISTGYNSAMQSWDGFRGSDLKTGTSKWDIG